MNRRKFLLLFGGSVAALGLPSAFQLPESIPETLPTLPTVASRGLRFLVSLSAYGNGPVSRWKQIAITRIASKQCIFLTSINSYGGMLHLQLPPDMEIVEIPGQEVAIEVNDRDIAWVATWRNEDGSYDITASDGETEIVPSDPKT